MNSLKAREKFIEDSLESAKKAEEELVSIQSKNEDLLIEARKRERWSLLRQKVSNSMKDEAKQSAKEMADKIILDAKNVIDTEKDKAMNDVKNKLAELSINIAEKIIKNELSNDSSQKKYVDDLIKEINDSE